MNAPAWTCADLPDQEGRTVVITGGNSGIGLATARGLAGVGARVILAVRDVVKGADAAATIDGEVEVDRLDLASLRSVREFADRVTEPIDVLINNAGIMFVPLGSTEDGFEMHFGVNHLGPFALTSLLLPRIRDRVVTVSSQAHRRAALDIDDLNWGSREYSPLGAYGQSKLANLLFTLELQRRLTASNSHVSAFASHPGYAATNLQGRSGSRLAGALLRIGNAIVAQDAESGALPSLFAATMPIPLGSYVGPSGFYEYSGAPTLVGRSRNACDFGLARALWAKSEEFTGNATETP
ncbi:oxidoreductase [Gordonia sp. (in: high G+C Gram-positive bacteria)]|uniref:oxidoreductase n=1 Tax=Gordonia sp. (in: high G+C Gram-positive bacteria) TaxID=84139 RepID=UPI003F9962AE